MVSLVFLAAGWLAAGMPWFSSIRLLLLQKGSLGSFLWQFWDSKNSKWASPKALVLLSFCPRHFAYAPLTKASHMANSISRDGETHSTRHKAKQRTFRHRGILWPVLQSITIMICYFCFIHYFTHSGNNKAVAIVPCEHAFYKNLEIAFFKMSPVGVLQKKHPCGFSYKKNAPRA